MKVGMNLKIDNNLYGYFKFELINSAAFDFMKNTLFS